MAAIQKHLTLVTAASVGGQTKRSLGTNWISKVLTMLHHLGPTPFTHAESLQERDKAELAAAALDLAVDLIARDVDGNPPTYNSPACYVPSATWVVNHPYQRLNELAKFNEANVGKTDRPIGCLVFGTCWAYYFTTGKIIDSKNFSNNIATMINDLKAETEAARTGNLEMQLATPLSTRLNMWDHHLITKIEQGAFAYALLVWM
jgi:hypothetical protein